MPFTKGKSGNPGGKPKEFTNVIAQARKMTPLALTVLKSVLENAKVSPGTRIRAAEIVLDRGWGKATQVVEGMGKFGDGPIIITIDPFRNHREVMAEVAAEKLAIEDGNGHNGSNGHNGKNGNGSGGG